MALEVRKLNSLRKKFQQHTITYTGHWFPEQNLRKSNIFFKSPCFILGDFSFKGLYLSEKATDDRNILGCESGDQVLQIYDKPDVENLMLLSL